MARLFYFTALYDDEFYASDHHGNIRGAITKAEKLAKATGKDIYVNDSATDDIVYVAFAPPKTKFAVTTTIYDSGIVKISKPIEFEDDEYRKAFVSRQNCDYYVDVFDTFEDAEAFIRQARV